MLYFSICFTLLVLLASLHFLGKFKKEGYGKLHIWGSYLIMIAAVLILLCQLGRGVVMMRHHMMCRPGMERCEGGMKGGMMCHRDGMSCCMDRGGCCDRCCDGGMMKCDGDKMMCDKDKMKCSKDSGAACCKGMKEMDEKKEQMEKKEQQEKKEKAEKK